LTEAQKASASTVHNGYYSIPQYRLTTDIDLAELLEFQKNLKENEDTEVSLNDFVVRACVSASKKVPESRDLWFGQNINRMTDFDFTFTLGNESTGLHNVLLPNVSRMPMRKISQILEEHQENIDNGRASETSPTSGVRELVILGCDYEYFEFGQFGRLELQWSDSRASVVVSLCGRAETTADWV
jgi:pyruvate dehydrogenase E2 component (dihydrolipoamide acetyltransferase)